jgi:hypothetical protein
MMKLMEEPHYWSRHLAAAVVGGDEIDGAVECGEAELIDVNERLFD